MKIVVIARTLNESANIDRFCTSYDWADAILIADGGSEDDTVERSIKYHNASVRSFEERIYNNELWRNPHGRHINFMIDWAIDEGADWIIFDDVDCVPTIGLQNNLRDIMDHATHPVIMVYRLYIWGDNQYFPNMNKSGQSLHAWRSPMNIQAWEGDPLSHRISGWDESDILRLDKPLCCLHYFYPDAETVARKKAFYEGIGKQKLVPDPLKVFGPLETLPDWAKVK